VPQRTLKTLPFIKADPNRPRKHFEQDDLLALGASMKRLGQLQRIVRAAHNRRSRDNRGRRSDGPELTHPSTVRCASHS
jgi:ParB-like chromosome segregation protein Spo0J